MQNKIVTDKLSALFSMSTVPEGRKALLVDKMANVVNQRLLLRLLDFLSSEKKEEFEKIIKKDHSDSDLENFLIKNVPDFINWVSEEIEKLQTEMKEILK